MLSHLILSATLASLAAAHQNFHQFWVNGVSPGYQTCIRMPPSNNPVTDVTSNDITCNVNGNIVPSGVKTCAAAAGDSIEVQWDSSTHPGPITHFLYGPISDATQATGLGTWTKIDELDYQGTEWANEVMEAQNMTYTFKLPANLATGDYLLRGEMEALHASETLDGAQFYIGCAQLHITGPGGSCSPQIQLPGAYKATDPDIYISNFYNGFQMSTFTAPGGAVATCGKSGAAPAPVTTKASTTAKVSPTTTPVAVPPTTIKTTTAKATTSAVASSGSVAKYGQCGGTGYTGATTCVAGTTCTVSNEYYSQCL